MKKLEIVERLYRASEGGAMTREIEVGDVFVYSDGQAWMVTSTEGELEYREVADEELVVLRARRRSLTSAPPS